MSGHGVARLRRRAHLSRAFVAIDAAHLQRISGLHDIWLTIKVVLPAASEISPTALHRISPGYFCCNGRVAAVLRSRPIAVQTLVPDVTVHDRTSAVRFLEGGHLYPVWPTRPEHRHYSKLAAHVCVAVRFS